MCIYIYIYIPSQILFHCRLYDTEYSSQCYLVGVIFFYFSFFFSLNFGLSGNFCIRRGTLASSLEFTAEMGGDPDILLGPREKEPLGLVSR